MFFGTGPARRLHTTRMKIVLSLGTSIVIDGVIKHPRRHDHWPGPQELLTTPEPHSASVPNNT